MPALSALVAEPADSTPDTGPRHRRGPFTLFVAIFCAFSAAGIGRFLWLQDHRILSGLCALVLSALSLWACLYVFERVRRDTLLPRLPSVLAGALGFEIHCTCRDVAATVFFLPDQLSAGSSTRLLCFIENYASRHRIARFRIGPHAGLGLAEPLAISLQLAAGQAGVYALPLAVNDSLSAGEHDLPITLRVDKPTGTGLRLRASRRHYYDLWTVRFAAPFTVADLPAVPADAPNASATGPANARFVTLASASEVEPRLTVLQDLLTTTG